MATGNYTLGGGLMVDLTDYGGIAHGMQGLRSKSESTSMSGLDTQAKGISDSQFKDAYGKAGALSNTLMGGYGQMRQSAGGMFDDAMSRIAQLGDYSRGRINRDFNAQRGTAGQALANTGLYNTTVRENLRQGVERNRAEALGQLDESLRKQQIDTLMQRIQSMLGIDQQALGSQQQVGLQGLGFLADMAKTLPNYSRSTSTSLGR